MEKHKTANLAVDVDIRDEYKRIAAEEQCKSGETVKIRDLICDVLRADLRRRANGKPRRD